MNCPICGKPAKNKFCSSSCAAIFNNKENPKRKRTNKCKICGMLILASRTYCQNCWGGKRNRTHKICPVCGDRLLLKLFHSTGGRYPRPLRRCKNCHRVWRRQRKAKFKQMCVDYKGGRCEVCGYDKCNRSLIFHHKDCKKDVEIGSTWPTKKLTKKIIKELDKCVLLCANCHGEAHEQLQNGEWRN